MVANVTIEMSSLPLVSVIIPVWNGEDVLAMCLEAVQQQTYPRDRFEVLVVDNASTDRTREVVKSFPFVTLLEEPKPGSYCARNRAIPVAKGEYLAFTDADCIPQRDWLLNGIKRALANPEAGVFAGNIEIFLSSPNGTDTYEWFEKLFAFRQDLVSRSGICATGNWLSKKSDVTKFGGFREDLKSGADGELARRIHLSGRSVVYVPEMVVQHPARATYAELAKRRRRLVGGRWDRTKGPARFLRVLGTIVWDTLRRMKRTVIEDGPQLSTRIRIAYLVIAMSGVAIAELIRLALGSQAERA